jgi:hypothetical protein
MDVERLRTRTHYRTMSLSFMICLLYVVYIPPKSLSTICHCKYSLVYTPHFLNSYHESFGISGLYSIAAIALGLGLALASQISALMFDRICLLQKQERITTLASLPRLLYIMKKTNSTRVIGLAYSGFGENEQAVA